MSTDALTDADTPEQSSHHDDGGVHQGLTDIQYVIVAAILAGITALEVAISYVDIGPIFLPLLLGLMIIKFTVVVRLFMHLKFDSKIFTWLFGAGLFLAAGVYIAMLSAFHFFTG